jgi:predicted phosphodiesterase
LGTFLVRYAIISDIHANLGALQSVLADIVAQKCTHVACLGDIVGYGANPKECLDIIRGMDIPVVRGNHDDFIGNDYDPEWFNDASAESVSWTRAQLTAEDRKWLRTLDLVKIVANFTLVHSTLEKPQKWAYTFGNSDATVSFARQETPLCFYGHTHVPVAFVKDSSVRGGTFTKFKIEPGKQYLINAGSVGQPRDGNPKPAYVIYDIDLQTIELRRVAFEDPNDGLTHSLPGGRPIRPRYL